MTGEQLHLSPAESGDLYTHPKKYHHKEYSVAGVITSGGRPIKIHVRRKAKSRYKPLRTGRKTPYGTQTKHHYLVLQCPYCSHQIVSLYRVRHTYKSIHIWLRKAFNVKRFFRFPDVSMPHLRWYRNKELKHGIQVLKDEQLV